MENLTIPAVFGFFKNMFKGSQLMPRVTKPVEERRQEIIATAREMFSEYGFDKTQMADISKKMNVAAGTIYHYFKSKTELLYAVIDELTNKNMERKQRFLSDTEGSAFDRLQLIFTMFENGELHDESNSRFLADPAIIQYYFTKMSNSYLPILVSLIEHGNTDGSWSCKYPSETAVFILQGMAGVMTAEHERNDSPQEKRDRMKAYTNAVFRVLDTAK
ncbi:MAG: TetR/AcrR family transcriptional regulator [Dehalococcoidia bacterium]|nr:TetR/AcrR family transcriptional regulator [Dehalococcoidia bacterium]